MTETLRKPAIFSVDDPRLALALIAAEFAGQPSREMRVIGVTGIAHVMNYHSAGTAAGCAGI